MLWKRIAFCSILTILIIYCFRNFIITNSVKPLRIEMEVYADKSILLECFYTTQAEENFTAGKSVQYLFHPKDSGLISISLPVEHLHKIRLDLGVMPGKIRLGTLSIPGHTSIGYETGLSYYNIDNVIINGGGGRNIFSAGRSLYCFQRTSEY